MQKIHIFSLNFTVLILTVSINLAAADYHVAFAIDSDPINKMIEGESAEIKGYTSPRHISLMWLKNVDPND